jgi:PAS domain S-box-containing protein
VVGISVVVKDMTDLRRAQEDLRVLNEELEQRVEERTRQLRESQDLYRQRIDSIPHMVWSAVVDGTREYCDQQTLDYLDVTLEQMREMDWAQVLHPEDRERATAEFDEMRSAGREVQSDLRIRRARDGAYRWHSVCVVPIFDDEGRVLRWMGTCTDIQERKEVEERLWMMSRIFQDASQPILVQDEGCKVTDMNAEAEKFLGWTREELVGKSTKTILSSEWYETFDKQLALCLNQEDPSQEACLLLSKTGEMLECLITLSLLSDGGMGGSRRVALIAKDIRRIKRIEAALRSSEQALREEKEKLEDKNIALREILEQAEDDKSKIREEVAARIAEHVLPALDRLDGSGISPSLLADLRYEVVELGSPLGQSLQAGKPGLTAREKEICRLLKGGLSSKEIATILECSPQTVEKHRKNIRKKLGIVGKGTNLAACLIET